MNRYCERCKTCPLQLELSDMLGLCRWGRDELEPHWDEEDWLSDLHQHADTDWSGEE